MVININQKIFSLHFYYNKTWLIFVSIVVLLLWSVHSFIWLCCEYVQWVFVFGCIVTWVFAACFCIWLCCICSGFLFLQCVSVFGCVASIYSTCCHWWKSFCNLQVLFLFACVFLSCSTLSSLCHCVLCYLFKTSWSSWNENRQACETYIYVNFCL